MLRRILYSAILCLTIATAGWSQETRGTISGKISDPSGAVIPGASVVVTNTAMGTKTTLTSNQDGLYQATYLIPGIYQVEASSTGFKKILRENIEIRVGDHLDVNIELPVGASDQSVTVTAETPLLTAESASVGTVVDSKRVADLPLSYGNPFELIGSAAGVSFTGDARLDRPFEPTHIVGYAMAGSRGNLSDVTLDGAPTTATANGNQVIASYVPPTDIVSEFKVQTATFDAQFGQTQGGVTNISMKAGTNSFHGTAGYTSQRPSFWANDFFNNQQGKDRPDFMFNRWGGSFGGPVYIPKVYNGHNRTFFEWGYEGIHDSRPRHDDGTYTVPSTAEKAGDFSALLKAPNGSSYQIYNPFSRVAAAGGRYQEDPFPGNIIPSSLFSPVGVKVLSYFPTPLGSGDAAGLKNMVDSSVTEKAKYYNHSWRVDHNISDKQRMFVRASVYRRDSTYNNYFNNLATGVTFQFLSRAAVFDHVYTLSPTTVLNTRYSYNRFIRYQNGNTGANGFDLSSLGFPASYASQIPKDVGSFPQFNMTGYIPTGSAAGENRPVMNHTFSTILTKIHGTHSIRTGLEFRAYQENDKFFGFQQTGTFNFDSTWTRGPLDNSAVSPGSIGQSVAALLLGLPSASSNVARSADYAEQSNSWGMFVQDDWKVTPKLTLNLGLRYEFEQPLHERYNKSVLNFDPTFTQTFSAQAAANYAANDASLFTQTPISLRAMGGLTFAGINGNPSGLYNTPKNQAMPRLGLAYKINEATVLRSGFGIFYGFLGERRSDVIQHGFSQNTNVVPTQDNLHFTGTLSNPFPGGIANPVGTAAGYQTFLGQNIQFFNQNPMAPRVMRWEVGLQHVFHGNLLVDATYSGNKTIRIELNPTGNPNIININAIPDQYLCTSPVRDNTCNNYLTATVPNPFYGLGPANNTQAIFTNTTIARSSLLLPYPEFGTISTTRNQGYSWYHSLVLTVEKRFSKGYSITGNYTYSKFMQADELLNAGDPFPVRVISDQDVPHRLSISSVAELPFGPNRLLFHSTRPLVSRIAGGWQLSGIFGYQVGFPLAWGNVLYYGNPANIVLPADQRTVDHWFNTAGFETASSLQLANNLRTWPLRFSQIRGRNNNNVDLALIKNTRITEGKNIQFRAEALNAFNHPGFPAPVLTPTSTTFGTVVASNQAGYPRRLQLSIKYIF
jgi:hypothetical protein